MVKVLLDGKADIESTDKHGRTPLSNVEWNGHEAVVKLLVRLDRFERQHHLYKSTPRLIGSALGANSRFILVPKCGERAGHAKEDWRSSSDNLEPIRPQGISLYRIYLLI
jgi:ankyrin repeat protein